MSKALERSLTTVEDALARPDGERIELIRGALVQKAPSSAEHSAAHVHLSQGIVQHFSRKPGGRFPGGWWFAMSVDTRLGQELFRPDLAGWRRERSAEAPTGRPIVLRPDWVCEILSPSTESIDRVDKLQTYFRSGLPHYWLADPIEKVLEVYRRTELAFALVLTAKAGQKVRAEPFDAVELRVDELFGADPEDDPAPA